jgi:asparagine synthase (glutamine-hydrolysing)
MGPVAFGHNLLHTTPESLIERQPLPGAESRLLLCCDARIDNRAELVAETDLRGRRLAELSDADVVLAAWLRWGADCPEHLLGDFTIAAWDAREQTLFLARDHMGVRSLYYTVTPHLVAFATEIKALFAVPGVHRSLDELRLVQYLELDLHDAERTFYDGIRRVPAAHRIGVNREGLRKVRYWRLDPAREIRLASDDEYAGALREKFVRAVQRRTRCAFPVGSTLSGGLDSSGIACVARDLLAAGGTGSSRLHTFSAVFPGLPEKERKVADESEFIDAVLATGGFESHLVRVDHLTPFHEQDRVLYHVDEAPLAYNLYMHWALYGAARAAGVRVLLDGFDGDACVGYGRELFGELLRAGDWSAFERETRAVARTHGEQSKTPAQLARMYAGPVLEHFAMTGRWSAATRGTLQVSRRFGFRPARILARHVVLPALRRMADRVYLGDRRNATLSVVSIAGATRVGFASPAARMADKAVVLSPAELHAELLESPGYQLTLDVADKAAAAFSLEARYPFFDRDLLEFCVALPVSQRLSDGWPRYVYRRAMEGLLPDQVRWRVHKQDLSVAFNSGISASSQQIRSIATAPEGSRVAALVDHALLRQRLGRVEGIVQHPARNSDFSTLYRVYLAHGFLKREAWL